MPRTSIKCPYCNIYNRKFLIHTDHLHLCHEFQIKNFKISCHIVGCDFSSSSTKQLIKHDKKIHKTTDIYIYDNIGGEYDHSLIMHNEPENNDINNINIDVEINESILNNSNVDNDYEIYNNSDNYDIDVIDKHL